MFSVIGVSWGALRALLGSLGRSWGTLGALLGRLGALLGRFWPLFGHSWGALGASWAALGALLGVSWGVLEASWGKYRKKVEGNQFFGTILEPKMEAKIIENHVKKAMRFSSRDCNVFC